MTTVAVCTMVFWTAARPLAAQDVSGAGSRPVLPGTSSPASPGGAHLTGFSDAGSLPEDSQRPADAGPAGHGFVEFRLGYYENDDSGNGNPFLDESLTIIEPIVVFDYNYSDRLAVHGKFSYDHVSSASIDRLSNYPDQSGASGDNYFGFDLGMRYALRPDLRLGAFLSTSFEYDYQSFGLGGHLERDLADRNATIKWSLNAFLDAIDVIRFDGSEEGGDDRVSITTSLSWYQVLGPRTHGELGSTFTYQSGFLETPYNAVVVEDPGLPPNPNLENLARGIEIVEELPDDRVRAALFGKVRHSLTGRTAVELGSRLYADTWGIASVSMEPRWYQWWVRERLYTRLRYRFYVQTAADDYDDRFELVESKRTQDSDLSAFSSHTFGLQFVWVLSERVRLDLGGDLVKRSDGLDQVLGSIGLRYDF